MASGISFGSDRNCVDEYSIYSIPATTSFDVVSEQVIGKYLVLLVDYGYMGDDMKILIYTGFKTSAALLKFNLFRLEPVIEDRKGAPFAIFAAELASLHLIEKMLAD
jgi:hypothetical protein